MNAPRTVLTLLALLMISACTSASAIPTGTNRYTPVEPSKLIDTYFAGQTPSRQYEEIGIVRGHYKAGTAWSSADVADLLPELHNKAREIGADAIIIANVNRYLGAALNPRYRTIPNVEATAIAIRYRSGSDASVMASSRLSGGISGTYAGEISGTALGRPFSMRITFTIVQTGDELAGAWTTTAGTSGAVAGTVADGTITSFRAKQINPCPGLFTGSATTTAGAAILRGSYAGNDCGGPVTASFTVSRQ